MKTIKMNDNVKANLEKTFGLGTEWINPRDKSDVRIYWNIRDYVLANILEEDSLTRSERNTVAQIKVFYSKLTDKLTISDRDLNSSQKSFFKEFFYDEIIQKIGK